MWVTVVAAEDPAWDEYLRDVPHDVYHTAGYHRFERRRGAGEPYLFVAESAAQRVVWPYLLRPVEIHGAATGHADVTSAYGYAGPLLLGDAPDQGVRDAVCQELLSVWRQQHVVSVFARLHPLLDNRNLAAAVGPQACPEGAGVVELGETVSIDCTLSDDEALASYARPLRKHLAHAAELGYQVIEDVEWCQLDDFVRLYQESMDRNGADDFYRFTVDDFRFLRDALPGQVHLLLVNAGDEAVAGGLFTRSSGIVQAHLTGTATAFLSTSPSKALLDGVRRWVRSVDGPLLHLGGGRGGRNDSLFRFKREFSKRRHPFAIGRWVVDRRAYQELCRHGGPQDADGGYPDRGYLDRGGYFPAYRAPVTTNRGSSPGGRAVRGRAVPATATAAQNQANRES